MKKAVLSTISVLAFSGSAFAQKLICTGDGENLTIQMSSGKIIVSGYGELVREKQDQDCGYRSKRFACYEDKGQLMVNIPLALSEGKVKRGTVYIQSDTGDNVDAHNHAQLGFPYACTVK